jgi:hypothetical protein
MTSTITITVPTTLETTVTQRYHKHNFSYKTGNKSETETRDISGLHGGEYGDDSILGYGAV